MEHSLNDILSDPKDRVRLDISRFAQHKIIKSQLTTTKRIFCIHLTSRRAVCEAERFRDKGVSLGLVGEVGSRL